MNELSPAARRVLAMSRQADGPSPEQRAAMKHTVLAAVATAPVVVAGSAAAKTASIAGTAAAKLAVAIAVAGATVGGGWLVTRAEPQPVTAPPKAGTLRAPAPEAPHVAEPQHLVEPAPTVAPKRARATPSLRSASSEEVLAVSTSLADVSAGRYGEALERLRALRLRFPQSLLATEAETVEVLALCGLGRAEEAERLAVLLREHDASNPSLRRLEASCVGKRK